MLNRRLLALNLFSRENKLDKYNVCALKFYKQIKVCNSFFSCDTITRTSYAGLARQTPGGRSENGLDASVRMARRRNPNYIFDPYLRRWREREVVEHKKKPASLGLF